MKKSSIFASGWRKIIFLGLIVMGCCGCIYAILLSPPIASDHVRVTVTQVSLCQYQNNATTLIETDEISLTNNKTISICGHLQANSRPIGMVVRWYYENKLVFDEIISMKDLSHDFRTTLVSSKKFTLQPGNYRVHFVIGRALIWQIQFRVKD